MENDELEKYKLQDRFDNRYSFKWVERALKWFLYAVALILISAIFSSILNKASISFSDPSQPTVSNSK